MTSRFRPHLEILPASQRRLWPELRPASRMGFVLYGGTAIALQLGHRQSIDFDLFTRNHLDKSVLTAALQFVDRATVLQDQPDIYTLLVSLPPDDRPVKVSFFGNIDFGRVGTPMLSEDGVLQIASRDDLMATKLKVLLQRVEAKDYIDVAAMLGVGVDLPKGLAAARLLFGQAFQPAECLKALVFFQGGDLALLPEETKRSLVEAAKSVGTLPQVALTSRELAVPLDIASGA